MEQKEVIRNTSQEKAVYEEMRRVQKLYNSVDLDKERDISKTADSASGAKLFRYKRRNGDEIEYCLTKKGILMTTRNNEGNIVGYSVQYYSERGCKNRRDFIKEYRKYIGEEFKDRKGSFPSKGQQKPAKAQTKPAKPQKLEAAKSKPVNEQKPAGTKRSPVKKQKPVNEQKKPAKVKSKPVKGQKPARNPFMKVNDVYLTKNKIAVTTVETLPAKRGYVIKEKRKYYAKNSRNLKRLREAQGPTARLGRKGNTYIGI